MSLTERTESVFHPAAVNGRDWGEGGEYFRAAVHHLLSPPRGRVHRVLSHLIKIKSLTPDEKGGGVYMLMFMNKHQLRLSSSKKIYIQNSQ